MALAVGLLVVLGVLLLLTDGVTVKVLVAIWLWSLPVLGLGAGLGWAIGTTASRLTGPRTED
jgi:hypothetical protein